MQRLQNLILTEFSDFSLVSSIAGENHIIEKRQWYGLSFCQSGQITYEHRGKRTVSTPDKAILLPQGETYRLYRDKTGDFPLINFFCTPEFDVHEILAIPIRNPESYIRDFTLMRDLSFFPYNRHKLFSLFYGLLHRLAQEGMGHDSALQPVLAYIEQHYTDWDISNDTLAAQAGISEVYMRQQFRQQMGTSPKQYILERRMDRARQLLSEGSLGIAQIAAACGFSSPANFGVCFRRVTGMTPREYRQRNRVVL